METIEDYRHIELREKLCDSKSYRHICLLCHIYRLYEGIILNIVTPLLGQHLIKEQAGFRPGKSCTSQLFNLTQHIEDGYQSGMITGAAFVDLSAAYDTVNHRILIQMLYNITQDSHLCRVLQNIMACPKEVSSHQSSSTSTLMISHFMTERVASYTQTIYVSQPSTLHSQR